MEIYVVSKQIKSRKENLRDAVLHCISKNERSKNPESFWVEFEGENFKPHELGHAVTYGEVIMAALGAKPRNEKEYEALFMINAREILSRHGFKQDANPVSDMFQDIEDAKKYLQQK